MSDTAETLRRYDIVVSMASIPCRLEYCIRAMKSILRQDAVGRVSEIVINLDDDATDAEFDGYTDSVASLDGRISVLRRPAAWRSANKLLWTCREHPQSDVVTLDDDCDYDSECLSQLLSASEENPGCVICQQSNPVTFNDALHRYEYMNWIDVKLRQRGFSKFLSKCCLFPSGTLSPLAYDFERFRYVTECRHDELWFWIMTVLNRRRVVQLDSLGYFQPDYRDDECACATGEALYFNNLSAEATEGFNRRTDEVFGKDMRKVFEEMPVEFHVTRANAYATFMSLEFIHNLYHGFNLDFIFDADVSDSWFNCISEQIDGFLWVPSTVKVRRNAPKPSITTI